jgi:mono/diheme cytochrome c family protein
MQMVSPTSAVAAPQSRWPRLAALILALAVAVAAARQFLLDWQRILDLRPVDLYLAGGLPEQGGWVGGPLRVASGRRVRLTVESIAGTHSFALAHTPVQSSRPLAPGESETVAFTAPAPGRYVLYCTTWCSPNHWRMRTVVEVFDPSDPEAGLAYPQQPPRYALALEMLPLDAVHQADPHTAEMTPAARPDAASGAAIWQQLAPVQTPQALLAAWGWPVMTAQEAYDYLSQGKAPGLEAAADLTEAERWSLVAYLWQQSATPETLARAAALFAQNCAGCHGESGRGDGLAAPFSPEAEPDLTDLGYAMSRAPAVYYAKIARGGMGTGMPNWGTILPESDLWALTAYLQAFMFADPVETAKE